MIKHKLSRKLTENGFTLVELIVSIAIIGIMVIAILSIFTSGFSTIFEMGRKTEAANTAQGFIEAVYSQGLTNVATVATSYNSTLEATYSNMNASLYNSANPTKVVFHNVDNTGSNPKFTVLVFYQNGNRFVKLSALMP